MSTLSEVNSSLTEEPEPDESVLSQLDVWSAFRSLASCDANIGTPRQRRSLQAFLQITDIAKEWMKLQSDYPSGSLGLEATEHLSRILIVLGTECRRLQSGELDGKTNGSADLDSKCEDPRSPQQESESPCELSPAEEECVRELYMAQSALAGKKLAMSFQNSDGLRDFRQRVKDLERRIGTLESFLHGDCTGGVRAGPTRGKLILSVEGMFEFLEQRGIHRDWSKVSIAATSSQALELCWDADLRKIEVYARVSDGETRFMHAKKTCVTCRIASKKCHSRPGFGCRTCCKHTEGDESESRWCICLPAQWNATRDGPAAPVLFSEKKQ